MKQIPLLLSLLLHSSSLISCEGKINRIENKEHRQYQKKQEAKQKWIQFITEKDRQEEEEREYSETFLSALYVTIKNIFNFSE